jgi:hypothetical protein
MQAPIHDQKERRFAPDERRLLMNERGINALVITRLEQAGYRSIDQLRAAGIPAVVGDVCRLVGTLAWENRRRPLERAMENACARQRAER